MLSLEFNPIKSMKTIYITITMKILFQVSCYTKQLLQPIISFEISTEEVLGLKLHVDRFGEVSDLC